VRNHPAVKKSFLTQQNKEQRVGFALEYSFIIPRVVQIMSIIFQTGHELSIVLGNESKSASARVRFPSTIE
jgi:hypothetical protein